MKALLVVDMIHDFVDGKFGSEEAKGIAKKMAKFIERFREENKIIYLRDSHTEKDAELKVWGEHAMRGTWGSEIVEELKPLRGKVIEKNTYDGFLFTSLESFLREREIEEVYICGVATDICVLHTAFGAFARGFKVNIIRDLCAGTSEENHKWAIEYMKKIYGANIVESDEI